MQWGSIPLNDWLPIDETRTLPLKDSYVEPKFVWQNKETLRDRAGTDTQCIRNHKPSGCWKKSNKHLDRRYRKLTWAELQFLAN